MGTYTIDNRFPKIGEIILQDGMTLRSKDGVEGLCNIFNGHLYVYPVSGDDPTLVRIGEEVEVLSEQRDMRELDKRQKAVYHRQFSWQEQIGEENTRQFDSSNESWG